MSEYTRFEYQYILTLAVRAKQDLIGELKIEEEKMELYKNSDSFIDPNTKNYIEVLKSIIKKTRENINKFDEQGAQNE